MNLKNLNQYLNLSIYFVSLDEGQNHKWFDLLLTFFFWNTAINYFVYLEIFDQIEHTFVC